MQNEFSSKASIRKWAKKVRKDFLHCNEKIIENLKCSKEYQIATNIMIFYPLENEINLLSLLEDSSKKFFLPKIDDKELLCCPYSGNENLVKSCFDTQEPCTEACDKKDIDLVIVPALCCDKNNYRLGYGGGFYDRFLQDFGGKTVCCINKNLVVKTIFPEEHDIKMDIIITD